MKRLIGFLLILSFCLCLSACGTQDEPLQEPVRFYFPRTKPTYGASDSVITWELREADGHENDYAYLLGMYLKGPESEGLSRTFPRYVTLKSLEITESNALVVLSDTAARLSGLELTMACACLTATVADLTGVQTVTICAETLLLDGNQSITMDREHLLLVEDSTGTAAED